MSDAGRKRGAGEGGENSYRGNNGPFGAAGTAGALTSSSISSKKARQPSYDEATASSSNGHPSAIIAPHCTYGTVDAKECPHTMVSLLFPRERVSLFSQGCLLLSRTFGGRPQAATAATTASGRLKRLSKRALNSVLFSEGQCEGSSSAAVCPEQQYDPLLRGAAVSVPSYECNSSVVPRDFARLVPRYRLTQTAL